MEKIEMVKEMYGDVSRMMIPTSIRIHASKYIFIIIIIIQIKNKCKQFKSIQKSKKEKVKRAYTGIEPVTSRTLSENHTTRPAGLEGKVIFLLQTTLTRNQLIAYRKTCPRKTK